MLGERLQKNQYFSCILKNRFVSSVKLITVLIKSHEVNIVGNTMGNVSEKSIERLILYRRLLLTLQGENKANIFSHQLASLTGFTSAQVRRDIMVIGYSGSPINGYDLKSLLESLGEFIDAPTCREVAIVGLGHVGHAILAYFHGRRPNLEITAAFDTDQEKVNRVIHGCRCYHTNDIEKIISSARIRVGIISVPADEAQAIADRLIDSGVKGILNYAPVKLHLPPDIYVENRDMIMSVEKAAYFARQLQR